MNNPGLIRNRLKFKALINNAVVYLKLREEFGSLKAYLDKFGCSHTIYDHVSTTSPLSDLISKDLKKRGMKFLGSTTVYAYLQAIGVVNAHFPECNFYVKDKSQ